MLLPRPITAGERIALVAPASPIGSLGDVQLAIEALEKAGFSVHTPRRRLCCRTSASAYLAGPDWVRVSEMNSALSDSGIRAIMCLRGGYGSMRLLRALDYEAAAADPKPIVGFSDTTALSMALNTRCGLVTCHGPVATTLATHIRDGDSLPVTRLFDLLSGKGVCDNLWELTSNAGAGIRVIRHGRATGALLGGNLSIVCSLLGTPYLPPLDGCLLFFEDTGEPLYCIDRMLTQLELSGVFETAAGVVFGEFTGTDDDVEQLLLRRFRASRFPVISGLGSGHGRRNLALMLGLTHTLDTNQRLLAPADTVSRSG